MEHKTYHGYFGTQSPTVVLRHTITGQVVVLTVEWNPTTEKWGILFLTNLNGGYHYWLEGEFNDRISKIRIRMAILRDNYLAMTNSFSPEPDMAEWKVLS